MIKLLDIIADILENYPKLKGWSNSHAYSIYSSIQEQQIIKEFLYTVNPKKTIEQLKSRLNSIISKIRISKSPKGNISFIYITMRGYVSKESVAELNKFMETFGWYPAAITQGNSIGKYSTEIDKNYNKFNVEIQYEAKYDIEVPISEINNLYHILPDTVYAHVKNMGLTAKTQGKLANHPGRIYLIDTDDYSTLEWLAKQLHITNPNSERIENMILVSIDKSKIKNIKLFEDPNFEEGDAFYTYENIPPVAIKYEKSFKMK